MVVFDATVVLPLVHRAAPVPTDPETGQPIDGFHERVMGLIARLSGEGTKIVIPTPVLAEVLVRAGDIKTAILDLIGDDRASFQIVGFTQRAAVEHARITLEEIGQGIKADETTTWAKLKFDRQIVAIAKVSGATTLYSDDKKMHAVGSRNGLDVVRSGELPLPKTQLRLNV